MQPHTWVVIKKNKWNFSMVQWSIWSLLLQSALIESALTLNNPLIKRRHKGYNSE